MAPDIEGAVSAVIAIATKSLADGDPATAREVLRERLRSIDMTLFEATDRHLAALRALRSLADQAKVPSAEVASLNATGWRVASALLGTSHPHALKWASWAALSLRRAQRLDEACTLLEAVLTAEQPQDELMRHWVMSVACGILIEARRFQLALPWCRENLAWERRQTSRRRAIDAEYFLCRALMGVGAFDEGIERTEDLLAFVSERAQRAGISDVARRRTLSLKAELETLLDFAKADTGTRSSRDE